VLAFAIFIFIFAFAIIFSPSRCRFADFRFHFPFIPEFAAAFRHYFAAELSPPPFSPAPPCHPRHTRHAVCRFTLWPRPADISPAISPSFIATIAASFFFFATIFTAPRPFRHFRFRHDFGDTLPIFMLSLKPPTPLPLSPLFAGGCAPPPLPDTHAPAAMPSRDAAEFDSRCLMPRAAANRRYAEMLTTPDVFARHA